MGPGLGQAHQTNLGEGPHTRSPPGGRPPEGPVVVLGVGHVHAGPVDGHQPPPPVERPPGARCGEGTGHRLEEGLQHLGAEPAPGSEQGCLVRYVPGMRPPRHPRQALNEVTHHLLVGGLREQGQGEHVVDHHPGRQQPVPDLPAAGIADHAVHQFRGKDPRKYAQGDVVGEALVVLRLHPSGPRHGSKITPV